MIEKLTKINQRINSLFDVGRGGTPELTGNEILLGTIGCEPAYVEMIILLHMQVTGKRLTYSEKGLAKYLNVSDKKFKEMTKNVDIKELIKRIRHIRNGMGITLASEQQIFNDCQREYIEKSLVTNKKILLDNDELLLITRVAIVSLLDNVNKEVDIYNRLGVSQSSYQNKYRETFNFTLYYIYGELRDIVLQVYKRLDLI